MGGWEGEEKEEGVGKDQGLLTQHELSDACLHVQGGGLGARQDVEQGGGGDVGGQQDGGGLLGEDGQQGGKCGGQLHQGGQPLDADEEGGGDPRGVGEP